MIPFVRKSVHLALSDAFEQHMTKLKRVLKTFGVDSSLDNPVYKEPYEALESYIRGLKLKITVENTAKHAFEAKAKRLEEKLDLSLKLARDFRESEAVRHLRNVMNGGGEEFEAAENFLNKLKVLERESDHMLSKTVELKEPLIKGIGMTSGEIREKPVRVRQQDSRSISGGQVSSQPRSHELRQDDVLMNPAHPASPLHPIHHHEPAPARSYEPACSRPYDSSPSYSPSDSGSSSSDSCSSPSSSD